MKHVFLAIIAWLAISAGASAQSDSWRFLDASPDTDDNPVATVVSKGSTLSLAAFECGVWGMLFKPNPGRIPSDLLTETVKFGITSDGTERWSYSEWTFDSEKMIRVRIDESDASWKKWIDIMARANRSVTFAITGDGGNFEAEFSAKGSSAAIAAAREARCSPGQSEVEQSEPAPDVDRVLGGPVAFSWARFSYSGNGMPFVGVTDGDEGDFSLYCVSPGRYQASYSLPEGDLDPALSNAGKVAIGVENGEGNSATLVGSEPGSGNGLLYFSGDLQEGTKLWGLLRYGEGDLKVFLRVLGKKDKFNERTVTLKGAAEILASYAEQCTLG